MSNRRTCADCGLLKDADQFDHPNTRGAAVCRKCMGTATEIVLRAAYEDEIDAIRTSCAALEPLSADAQQRALRYLWNRYQEQGS